MASASQDEVQLDDPSLHAVDRAVSITKVDGKCTSFRMGPTYVAEYGQQNDSIYTLALLGIN